MYNTLHNTKIPRRIRKIISIAVITGTLLLSGCSLRPDERSLDEWVAPSADHIWVPPPVSETRRPAEAKKIDIPADLLKPGTKWNLMDIVSIALQNNPDTRAAWYVARSAAADWLSRKGDYYPQIEANVSVSHTDSSYAINQGGKTLNSFEPSIQLSWLLFDFGGRNAAVEEKRQALLYADFAHNAAIQNAVFIVLQTYYQYANAKAVEKAYKISVKDAATNLESSQQRHQQGLATIADVLLAKTALSQARLKLDAASGQVQTIRGALATAMGIPANTPYDIEELPLNPPVKQVTETVDDYIKKAQTNRPDLAAQRSRVDQSLAHIRTTRSALYPSLVLDNDLYETIDNQRSKWDNQNTTALVVKIPIFYGYSRRYDEIKAREDADVEKAQLNSLEQSVILQVWSSYFNLKTAVQQVSTSADLLNSAQQSYDVALGRYKEGVGGFLGLLAAQNALESARAQRVTALADWYISLAQLARDTGILWRKTPAEQADMPDLFPTTTIKEQQP